VIAIAVAVAVAVVEPIVEWYEDQVADAGIEVVDVVVVIVKVADVIVVEVDLADAVAVVAGGDAGTPAQVEGVVEADGSVAAPGSRFDSGYESIMRVVDTGQSAPTVEQVPELDHTGSPDTAELEEVVDHTY
jgi:hypothetical protein